MGKILAALFLFLLQAPFFAAAQQSEKPMAALAPVAVLGDISEGKKRIIFNSLQSSLSQDYQLIPQELYDKAEEAAFESLDLENCTEEQCIRRIQEILQVDRLVVLQIIREEDVSQLTLTIVRSDDKIVRAGICQNCGIAELEARVSGLVAAAVELDLGTARPSPRLPVAPKVQTGSILVASSPPGAQISLDGQIMPGLTDTRLDNISPGEHTVVLAKDNLTATRTFNLVAGQVLPINLALVPRKVALSINSQPAGALALLDGLPIGITPLVVQAAPGSHRVDLSKAGFNSVTRTVQVTGEGPNNLEATLAEIRGSSSNRADSTFFFGTGLGLGNAAVLSTSVLAGGSNLVGGLFLGRNLMMGGELSSGDLVLTDIFADDEFDGTYQKLGGFLRMFLGTNSFFLLLGYEEHLFTGTVSSRDSFFSGDPTIVDEDYSLVVQTLTFGLGNQWSWESGFVLNVDWFWISLPLSSEASNDDASLDDIRLVMEESIIIGITMLTMGFAF